MRKEIVAIWTNTAAAAGERGALVGRSVGRSVDRDGGAGMVWRGGGPGVFFLFGVGFFYNKKIKKKKNFFFFFGPPPPPQYCVIVTNNKFTNF